MNNNRGFTLIELIVVIVLLGILATTAAPKFLNMQHDARNSTIEGLAGTIHSAVAEAYGKLAIAGYASKESVYSFGSDPELDWCSLCAFFYGYPGNIPNTWNYLLTGVTYGTGGDFRVGSKRNEPGAFFSFEDNFDTSQFITVDNCYVKYTYATETSPYALDIVPCE